MKRECINVGDSLYLSRQKVIVCEILHPFQLVAVRYENDTRKFVVDQFALSDTQTYTHAVSITLFKGASI